MAEQLTVRIIDPDDGKTYDVLLDEAARNLLTSASSSVTTIETAITDHVNNTFTADEAEVIALSAVDIIAQEGLFL
jgi:hypothetical protein